MASFGAQLKREREQRKISLDDISVSTKIGTRFLRAIEENHFDQLPGGIFNKGFVRAYARYVGLDEEQAIADYLAATGAEPAVQKSEAPIQVPPTVVQEASREAQIPWGAAAVVLLIAALSLATWAFYSRAKKTESTTQANPAGPESRPGNADLRAASVGNAVGEPVAQSSVRNDQVVSSPRSSTGTFVVLLKARDDSWISAAVDGNSPQEETLVGSTQKSFEGRRQVVLKAGNIGAVDVYFNGQKIPSQGEEGEVKTLIFGAKGLQVPTKPQAAPEAVPRN